MRRRFLVVTLVVGCLAGCSAQELDQSLNNVVKSIGNIGGATSCQTRAAQAAYSAGKTPAQATADIRRQCGSL